MDLNPTELQRCHQVYLNVHEMLADRNYAIDKNNASITLQQFRDRFGQHPNRRQMMLVYEKKKREEEVLEPIAKKSKNSSNDDDEDVDDKNAQKKEEKEDTKKDGRADEDEEEETGSIVVWFATDPKVKVGAIRELVKLMRDNDAQQSILIVQAGITSSANTALRQLAPRLRIQIFLEQEMLCMSAIMHHELQPQFFVLTKRQKTALLAKYRIKDSNLPKYLETDPIPRYYGLQRGQVVKIVRPSETAGRYTTYRVVVPAELKLNKVASK